MDELSTSTHWNLEKAELELISKSFKILVRRFSVFSQLWHLEVHSDGDIFLQLDRCDTREDVHTKYLLTIKYDYGHFSKGTIGSWKHSLTFNSHTAERHNISERFINPKLFKLLCKEALSATNQTIGIELNLHVVNLNTTNNNDDKNTTSPQPSVIPNFGKLLDETDFTDFTLVARWNGLEFKVHRAVLAARSPVFAKMFTDKSEKKLQLDDIGSDTLQELLRYVYCGKVNSFYRVEEILCAAEKYELDGLKVICQEYLCKRLSKTNVVDKFRLACQCKNAEILKNGAIEFMVDNMKDVLDELRFDTVVLENKEISKEIMRKLACKSP